MNDQTTILMAEDDEGHALLIKRALRKAGLNHEIVRFVNGEELLNFIEGGEFVTNEEHCGRYVLLLDIRMPKVDGIQALEKIKKFETLKELPVIMLTTTNNPDEIEKCYQLGCNSYMVKPVQHSDFVQTIQSLGQFLQKSEIPPSRRALASSE